MPKRIRKILFALLLCLVPANFSRPANHAEFTPPPKPQENNGANVLLTQAVTLEPSTLAQTL